jgi:hypothetical protein
MNKFRYHDSGKGSNSVADSRATNKFPKAQVDFPAVEIFSTAGIWDFHVYK